MSRIIPVMIMAAAVLAACSQPQQPQMTPMAGFIVVKEQPVQLIAGMAAVFAEALARRPR